MRKQLHLVVLRGHPPSEKVEHEVKYWAQHYPTVSLSTQVITSSTEMREAKKEWKFSDLPALIDKSSKKKGEWSRWYKDRIWDALEEIEKEGRKGYV